MKELVKEVHKVAFSLGNSAAVYVPKAWRGKQVLAILLED